MHFDSYAGLILHGGKLTTLDPSNPAANALAVQGDRILTVGSDEQALLHFRGPRTTVIDLGGRLHRQRRWPSDSARFSAGNRE